MVNKNLQLIGDGFFNSVYSTEQNSVIKIPKWTTNIIGETKEKLLYALDIHKQYLKEQIPNTEIKTGEMGKRGFYIEQEHILGKLLESNDLKDPYIEDQFNTLVKNGIAMETDKKLFFDIYGRNGFLNNSKQILTGKNNLIYSNFILTPDKKVFFIDIGYLPMSNPLVRCGKTIREMTNYFHK